MNRKEIAQETLKIQQQGHYEIHGSQVNFAKLQKYSEEKSFLIVPETSALIICEQTPPETGSFSLHTVTNQSAVEAIVNMCGRGSHPAVLNFASAKNPGGGFLNGAMAQEEALAASSGLYSTLLLHETYYTANRACGTMMYTEHAIYSPDVVFFRDGQFAFLPSPVTASVLTLPAVNMGQVLLKGEDAEQAKKVMKNRMRLSLAIFAKQGNRHLILGAYGCGVFRNDAEDVAQWWHELLTEEGYGRFFEEIVFAVLDGSKSQKNIAAFQHRLML